MGGFSADARYTRTAGAFPDGTNPSVLFVDAHNLTGSVHEEYGFTLADFQGRVVPYAYPGAPRVLRAGLTVPF